MSSKVFWKLLATALFLAYAIYQLSPLTTTPFEDFIQTRVTAKQEDFKQLLDEVRERVSAADVEAKAAGNVSQTTFYSALREISAGKGKLGKPVDLHQFFPDMLLVSDPNTERRNHYVLQEILRESQGKLKLGLDLQGGVSFTLRVDPKNFETKAEELELARKTAVREATKGLVKPDAPGLDAVQKEAAQKAWDDARAKAEKTAEADAKESAKAGELRLKEGLDRAITVMEGRVNAFGVAEPIIRRVGETSIEIQLPGKEAANNPDAINNLKKPAKLEFRMVHRYNRPEPGTPEGRIVPLREEPQNPASPIILYEVLYSRRELSARDAAESGRKAGDVEETPYYVQKTAAAAGNIVKSARAQSQDGFAWETSMSFTSAGTKKFEELTGKIADKNNEQLREYKKVINEGRLAIVLDGKLVLAPGIEIDKTTHEYRAIGGGGASIKADSQKAAADLANVLNNPLEFPLDLQNSKQIGASLAQDAQDKSINAAAWGIGLVLVFMLIYYLWAGFIAVLGLVLNVVLMLGLMAAFGATITLPGVAALVLTIGMAVDANILVFERVREELAEGKALKVAIHSGYDRAQATILDANLTSLMSAAVLIWMGTGPVRGFGIIFAIGIVTTVFTALITCRAIQEFCVDKGVFTKIFGVHIFKGNTKFNFLSVAKPSLVISWTIALMCLGAIFYKGGDAFSKDFKGGEAAVVKVVQGKTLDTGEIIKAANEAGVEDVTATYQASLGGNKELTLRIETELSAGKKLPDFTQVDKAVEAVRAKYPDQFPQGSLNSIVDGRESVGGAVSEGLQKNAIFSMLLALLGIAIYVALRFEGGMGLGAFISSLHDVLLTGGLYILVGKQFSISMIAAMLMVIGYSINDTIVVFDRIREEMKRHPGMGLADVINLSINRTLSRTVLTSLTIFLSALALWLLGAGDVKEYGLIFIFGIVTGTFSSIYIASPIFYWWHKGERTSVERAEAQAHYEWEAGTARPARKAGE